MPGNGDVSQKIYNSGSAVSSRFKLTHPSLDCANQLLVSIVRQLGVDNEKCVDHARNPKAQRQDNVH